MTLWQRTARLIKHPLSGLSHAAGALLAVAGLVFLIVESRGDPWRITSFAVYGATLILLYVCSALYHCLSVSERAEGVLYGLDRAAIYALIAGTYTPLCLVALPPAWGWSLFGVVWALAIGGIIADCVSRRRVPHWLQALLYVSCSYVFLVAVGPLVRSVSAAQLAWLAAGVVLYTGGAVVCVRHPLPHADKPHFHDLWHGLVMGASACHFVAMVLLARGV